MDKKDLVEVIARNACAIMATAAHFDKEHRELMNLCCSQIMAASTTLGEVSLEDGKAMVESYSKELGDLLDS